MLPTAGLFLPNTLHRSFDASQEEPDTRSGNRKYFGRKPKLFDRKSFDRISLDRKSITSTGRASEDASSGFSSLSTVFNFVDFALSRNDVSADNQVFVNLIHRVRHDLIEAVRLRSCPAVSSYYELYPEKQTRIDQILLDVQKALSEIGTYMENVRVSGDNGGSVGLKYKFEWVLSHHQKLQTRQGLLSVCHQSLMATIPLMQQLEMRGVQGSFELAGTMPNSFEAPNRPWLYDEGSGSVLHGTKKLQYSQRNLSLPSIMVSEHEGEQLRTQSINSIPFELPGSTPDDLPDPENWDLYAPPPTMPPKSSDPSASQRPLAQIRPRTCLDQSQPIMSFYEARSRESFDQARPRAASDQNRPRISADQIRSRPSLEEYKSRSSFDHISPLPRLVEKVSRNDSYASISDAAPVSLQAKRYRPRAVDIHKPPMEHSSLPSETQLPSIPAQSSLIMELSQWVLPGARTSDESNMAYDTPSTSITSSPIVTASPDSLPEISRPVASVKSITRISKSTSSTTSENVLLSPYISSPLNYSAQSLPFTDLAKNDAFITSSPPNLDAQTIPPSLKSRTSITRSPIPVNNITKGSDLPESKVQQHNSTITLAREYSTVDNTKSTLQGTNPEESVLEVALAEDAEFQGMLPLAVALELVTGVKPAFQVAGTRAAISEHSEISDISKSTTADTSASGPPTSDVDMPASESQAKDASFPTMLTRNDSTANVMAVNGPKPMIAQSKRRAAHARRMQLAYGSG